MKYGIILVECLNSIVSLFYVKTVFELFGKRRTNNMAITGMVYALYLTIYILEKTFIEYLWLNFLIFVLLIFLFSFAFVIKCKYRTISIISLISITFSITALFYYGYVVVAYITNTRLVNETLYRIIISTTPSIIMLLVSKIIQYKLMNHLDKNTKLMFVLLFVIDAIIFLCIIGVVTLNELLENKYFIISEIICFTILLIEILYLLIFEIYVKKSLYIHEQDVVKQKYLLERNYLQELVNKQLSVSRDMHDLKNAIFGIKNALDSNPIEGKKKIDELCFHVEDFQNIIYVNDTTIDSLINSKIKSDDAANINFRIESRISSFDSFDKTDLCILIGNLLDNAIEAANKTAEKYIKITFDEMPGLINMLISNTSNEVSEKLSTSKENVYAHGFGIKSIKEIVKKYNGAFSYCYEKGIFRVSILLCNSKING